MENKIMLELISKNLEEIKFFFETMLKEENPDPLLIEITTLKAKALYQELKLLMPKESLEGKDDIFDDDEIQPVIDQNDDNVQNPEEPVNEVSPEAISPVEEVIAIIENESAETVLNEELVSPGEEETVIESEEFPSIETDGQSLVSEDLILPIIEESEAEEPVSEESIKEEIIQEIASEGTVIEQETTVESSSEEENIFAEEDIQDVSSDVSSQEQEDVESKAEEAAIEPEKEEEIAEKPVELVDIISEAIEENTPVTGIFTEEETTGSNENKVEDQTGKELSLNEKLAAAGAHEVKIKPMPISSIKSAIGLNDRFLFTRELFGNDSSRYESTIDQLDQSSTLLEAIEFLEKNFQWKKSDVSLKFMDLVKRRFLN